MDPPAPPLTEPLGSKGTLHIAISSYSLKRK